MAFSFASLVERKQIIKVNFANGALEVAYRPEKHTPALIQRLNKWIEEGDALAIARLLVELISEAKIVDGDTVEPVEVTIEALAEAPMSVLSELCEAIAADAGVDPKAKGRSTGR